MCGIAGFIGIGEDGLLEAMLRSTRHRGPDGSGTWNDPSIPISLGHNRLSILDLSERGKQPMWDESGRYCIVYNGEIYNYRELRADLEASGYRFHSETDTEVLLYLFREKGPACLDSLDGIWAFAIWDRNDGKLYLSRDPLGVKPLYFVAEKGCFLFSSEIKSFLCWKDFPKKVDEEALFETLVYLWTPGPKTIFSSVRKLFPGQMVAVKPGSGPAVVFEVNIKPGGWLLEGDESIVIEQLTKKLHRSVQSQLVSDVAVGAFLSGGLDSSSVVAMAEREGHRISNCYTIDYAGGRTWEGMANDLDYARRVARFLDVKCIEIKLDSSVLHRIREMVWHLDEPQADLAPLNVLLIAEAARKNGDYVLLSGAGGDDIFSGYRRHVAFSNEKWWSWISPGMLARIRTISDHVLPSNATGRRVRKILRYADRNRDERMLRYFMWADERKVIDLFHDDLRRTLSGYDPLGIMRAELSDLADADPLDKMLFLDRRYFLTDHNLNYTDKMGMAKGIEIRVPLIGIDVVKFACRIPAELKQKRLTGKYIFKSAMEPFLPKEVIYRPKTGFVAPVREWMKGPLRERIQSALSKTALDRRGWFSPPAVQRLIDGLDGAGNDDHYLLLAVFLLEEWARLFIDGENI